MINSTQARGILLSIALVCAGATGVEASTLDLSYSTTASGTTGSGAVTNINTSTLYTVGNTFSNLTTTLYTPTSGPGAGVSFEFYDDYVFTLAGGSLSSISSTINIGNVFKIDNLQVRLYKAASNPTLPVLGTPVGGETDAQSATYIGLLGNSNTADILNNVQLGAGTYVLEFRGSVSGPFGGGYAGLVNVQPVPIPGAAWLLGSAVLGLAGAARRHS